MSRSPQARALKTVALILAAAEALVARQGLQSLTMDAVAAEAGVSKGGLLHHFRSKEALMAGLVSRKLASIRDGMAAEEQALRDAPRRALLAAIRHGARQYGDEDGFPSSLVLAATQNAECLSEVHALLGEKLDSFRTEDDRPDEALVYFFASFGLLLARALGFSTLGEDEARRVFETLEQMVRERAS